ncbi:hypothetical protein K474DRAFT_1390966 [Panus rudis PR-1116 ss-1]|nr:hypothetical protein K474DRAFT_1390966 [Panus rudis PR-1116 ss-1]
MIRGQYSHPSSSRTRSIRQSVRSVPNYCTKILVIGCLREWGCICGRGKQFGRKVWCLVCTHPSRDPTPFSIACTTRTRPLSRPYGSHACCLMPKLPLYRQCAMLQTVSWYLGHSCPGCCPNAVQICWYIISNVLPVYQTRIFMTQFLEGGVKYVRNLNYLELSLIERKLQCAV